MYLTCADAEMLDNMQKNSGNVKALCKTGDIVVMPEEAAAAGVPEGCARAIVTDTLNVHMMLKGIVDFAAEVSGLQKKYTETMTRLNKLEDKRTPDYLARTPAAVQEAEKKTLDGYKAKADLLQEQIDMFQLLARK